MRAIGGVLLALVLLAGPVLAAPFGGATPPTCAPFASGFDQPGSTPCERCFDDETNGGESDLDCGGPDCRACDAGFTCANAEDCSSGVCDEVIATCSAPTCTDNVRNGDESDVDCGGPTCSLRCAIGKACFVNSDCQSGNCQGGFCAP